MNLTNSLTKLIFATIICLYCSLSFAEPTTLTPFNQSQAIANGATIHYLTQENGATQQHYYMWHQHNKTCVGFHKYQLCSNKFSRGTNFIHLIRYISSVYDSSVYTPKHLYDNNLYNFNANADTANVVFWAPANSTQFYKASSDWQTLTKPNGLFVTSEQQMKQLCKIIYRRARHHYGRRRLKQHKFNLMMTQLLGLPPNNNYHGYIFFPLQVKLVVSNAIPNISNNTTIKDNGLFRPCSNPDVTKSACGQPNNFNPATDSPSYVNWFVNQAGNTHNIDSAKSYYGYPWTGLGYTYDWANVFFQHFSPESIVGISEFVIPQNGQIKVSLDKSGHIITYTPEQFCQ